MRIESLYGEGEKMHGVRSRNKEGNLLEKYVHLSGNIISRGLLISLKVDWLLRW